MQRSAQRYGGSRVIMLNIGVASVPVKVREREIAFVATYDTAVKGTIE